MPYFQVKCTIPLDMFAKLCPKLSRQLNWTRSCNDSKPSPLTDAPTIISPLWGWKNGKCRRLSQKYLGKTRRHRPRRARSAGPAPQYAVVLDWGLPQALWQEAARAQVAQQVDQLCPKRAQGLSPGDYIRLAAINRACEPVSKQAMWDWVCPDLPAAPRGPRPRRRN